MLDVEDVPALKTMELELGKLVCTIKSMKEVLGGHGQAVDVKNETPSHKRGPTMCQGCHEQRGRASLRLSRIYTPHPMIFVCRINVQAMTSRVIYTNKTQRRSIHSTTPAVGKPVLFFNPPFHVGSVGFAPAELL